eukprot:TRINITY_DN1979_c0_g1_i1.p1 TRINITY_DN1979_c0_g1~~TRINITY_DN1979_c0_g1_i1.p1  ORF type:complete len:288 (-),score=33.53 TRINITY_DN1979_c0_g1_i1:295-1158(-)
MRRSSKLCFISCLATGIALLCCAAALGAPWWYGIAQRASLWNYEVWILLVKTKFSWDTVCHGLDIIGNVDMACESISFLRASAALATMFSLVSFSVSVYFLCSRHMYNQDVDRRVIMALGNWAAFLCFMCCTGGTMLGFYLLSEMPVDSPGPGLFLFGVASLMSFVAFIAQMSMGPRCCCPIRKYDWDDAEYPRSARGHGAKGRAQLQHHHQQQWHQQSPNFTAGYSQQQSSPRFYGVYPQAQPYTATQQPLPMNPPAWGMRYPQVSQPHPSYGQFYPQQYAARNVV